MIVLDSSAALRCTLPQTDASEQARFRAVANDSVFISPTLFLSEVSNAVWKEVRFRGLAPEVAAPIIDNISGMTTVRHEDVALAKQALAIALRHHHSVYDCIYIALSRTLSAPILTADAKLRRKFPDDRFVELEL